MNQNPKSCSLRVGGLARLSTCDWPGQLAATVFCQGCAWDCPYCHNPALRPAQAGAAVAWPAIHDFLAGRRGLLDAVVFSGGEPTLQTALPDAIEDARQLGFRIGLHTAGMNPALFARVLPLLDWVGFDVKAPFSAYSRIAGVAGSGERACESLRSLLASSISYEVRTTVHPALLDVEDMQTLKEQLLALGVKHFVVQQFRATGVAAGRLPSSPGPLALPRDYAEGFAEFHMR